MAGQHLNLPLRGQCPQKKIRHYSKAVAEAQVYQLESVGLGRPENGRLHVYFCDPCQAWHAGHTLRSFDDPSSIIGANYGGLTVSSDRL